MPFEEGIEEKDRRRQARSESLGITVIRFSDDEVKNSLPFILEDLKAHIKNVKPTP
jgi:very-short-patch-repair endonuclease